MKSKRRHELQTNALANWIGEKIEVIKPYSNFIVLGILAVVILIAAVVFFINRGKQQVAEGWGDFTIEANKRELDTKELTKVAQSDPDSLAHLWALQRAADDHRNKGINLLYDERDEGLKELAASTKLYQEILKRADDDFLQRRARYGLAKALESKGDVDGAIKQYKELKSAAGDYAIGKDAKRQLARLERQRDFYKSFAEFKPGETSESSQSMLLPDRPDITFPGDLLPFPERPDISFPEGTGSASGGDFQPDLGTTDSSADDGASDTVTITNDSEGGSATETPLDPPPIDDKDEGSN